MKMTRYNACLLGQLAQLVEQRIENPRVRGSIPRLATKNTSKQVQRRPETQANSGVLAFFSSKQVQSGLLQSNGK